LENNLSVLLGQTLPTSVQIDTGASDVNADFSRVLLNNLDIDAGASNFTIKLGDKSMHTKVNMDVGMSSITYVVPKDSGISVKVDSGLSSQELGDLKEVGNNRYESENYAEAKNKIDIVGDMGMASLE